MKNIIHFYLSDAHHVLDPLGKHFVCVFTFSFFAIPHGMWIISSTTGIEPVLPAVETWSLNHWMSRGVPVYVFPNLHNITP